MPRASGIIMAAVAVLLIHMERAAVMVKSTIAAQPRWPLASCITLAAIWVSSPCLESAAASAKPPKNRNSTGLAKSVSDLLMSKTPSRVASTGMERAVMVMLTASVSHRMAMKTRIPAPC